MELIMLGIQLMLEFPLKVSERWIFGRTDSRQG